eukprot:TRINITY_DN22321_c0_g1_i1.p1 TRINITY_DN22321_c0_g1~~TRINITY_DN22321_c0_g1_i1.p1  ORF type:complete len:191 (+),score=72.01 TRINITY_DN22321_c0_g1_i1:58-630(+)
MASNYTTYSDDFSLGKPAPALTGLDFINGSAELSASKVNVIMFFAKWDKGGYGVISAVDALSKEYPEVNFIAIGTDPAKADIQRFLDKKEAALTFPVAFDAGKSVHNAYKEVTGLGAMGLPHLFIIKDGNIVWREQFGQAHPLSKGNFAEQLRRVTKGETLVDNGARPKAEPKQEEDAGPAEEEEMGGLF